MVLDFNFFEYLPVPSIVTDSSGTIIFINKLSKRLLGELYIPEDIKNVITLFPTIKLQKSKNNQILKDNKGFEVTIELEIVNYKDQNEIYLLFLKKINKSKFIEKKLYVIQQKYKAFEDFIDSIKEGVLVFDANGELQFSNKKAKFFLKIANTNKKKNCCMGGIRLFYQ